MTPEFARGSGTAGGTRRANQEYTLLKVVFFTSDMADRATRIAFTKREGTRGSLTMQEMASAYNGFRSVVMLALG